MRRPAPLLQALSSVLLLGLAAAHGHDEDVGNTMDATANMTMDAEPPIPIPPSYFSHGEYGNLMVAHIAFMTISWVFVLPVGVILSIARSRFSIFVQFAFLALNSTGILLATIYNARTPDLYPHNAHHTLGWVVTWLVVAQVVVAMLSQKRREVSRAERAQHRRWESLLRSPRAARFSVDSAPGTGESLRCQSISSTSDDALPSPMEHPEEGSAVERQGLLRLPRMPRLVSWGVSSRVASAGQFLYDVVDRVILILGFAALSSGIVTFGGLFMGHGVFSGLAHFIKGGLFFWYGILTLGRWAGCFADIGWAWNVKPVGSTRPSAEFVESFLIFFYGSTNVFLEHLGGWGGSWNASDFEHISITVMFIGGGLCGMLVESTRIRDLLNSTLSIEVARDSDEEKADEPPKSYQMSMNPIPALIILLLGMMMSSHHQQSMVSTMLHKQWGTLFLGGSFSRAATYIIFYLRPPTSFLPSRPPSELITAFCFIAGGLLFMASASDCVAAMENHGFDAMVIFTVSMGIVTFLMAWVIFVIAIKGLATRGSGTARGGPHRYMPA